MRTNDQAVVFSSENPNWGTPNELYDPLWSEFGFMLDIAGSAGWAKHERFFGPGTELDLDGTRAEDALAVDWRDGLNQHDAGFFNPPFSRKLKMPIEPWIQRAALYGRDRTIVGVIPARTDTTWWNAHIARAAAEIRFIPHRVKFVPPPGHLKKGFSAGFPTAIVVWRPQPGVIGTPPPRVVSWSYRKLAA